MIARAPRLASLCSRIVTPISVYEGISPALLATMSLSQGVKGSNNSELVESLVKSNILHNAKLQNTMKNIDRKAFIGQLGSHKTHYENKPYRISGGQTMTDIFTHAVILENCCSRLDTMLGQGAPRKLRVLDVGTGHGYLAYVLSAYLQEHWAQAHCEVVGIDSNKKAIEYCNSVRSKIDQSLGFLTFEEQTLEEYMGKAGHLDLIVGGFYMPSSLNQLLIDHLHESSKIRSVSTLGVWATDSPSGQSLYSFEHSEGKLNREEIMSTMFSMPTVQSSVSKFFLEEEDVIEEPQEHVDEEELRKQLLSLKQQKKKEEKEVLKETLKALILQHSTASGRKLSLQEMKHIPEINLVLNKLNQK